MPVETRAQRALRLDDERRAAIDWRNLPPELLQIIFRNLDGATFALVVPYVCQVRR
jgi:hypothetical protein